MCAEDFGAGCLSASVGAEEDGVLASVCVEDSAAFACIEDAGRDGARIAEVFADGWPALFAWFRDAGLWDQDGGGLCEGAFSGMHDEVEGTCATGALAVVEEGWGVDGEDGPGALPAGAVAGVLPVSELPGDGFEGLGADGVEFLLGPSARHRGFLRGLFGGGEGLRVAVGPGVFPVSRFPSPPGACDWKPFQRGAVLVSVGRLDGVSGPDEFVEGGADGLGAHSGGLADLAAGEGLAGLGEDGADALSGGGLGRCR